MKRRMILATCLTLLFAIVGCGRSSEYSATLDTHTLTILNAPEGPSGGTSLTNRDDAAKTETHTFESADERYKIELVNEVLTINGDFTDGIIGLWNKTHAKTRFAGTHRTRWLQRFRAANSTHYRRLRK